MDVRRKLKKRRRALKKLEEIFETPQTANLIHYSCESFYDRIDGTSPRITSIAIRCLGTGQTTSFSIHQVAERQLERTQDIEDDYNDLEKEMLDEFFEFVRIHLQYQWIHWNMRDVNYGFAAIEHRHRVLGGSPNSIPEVNRIDLARLLIEIYGPQYVGHPRLISLIELNGISTKDLLTGAQEAEAFEEKDYVRLHLSTLRKVDVFANILGRIENGSLKTKASWRDEYGTTFVGAVESFTDHWTFKVLSIVAIVFSAIFGPQKAIDFFTEDSRKILESAQPGLDPQDGQHPSEIDSQPDENGPSPNK